jgi:hypothetical protein
MSCLVVNRLIGAIIMECFVSMSNSLFAAFNMNTN